MKKFAFIMMLLVAIVGGGAWWLHTSLDNVVASAIRHYGPEITGVRVKLDGVRIDAAQGRAALQGLELGNPPGFRTERALSVATVSVALDLASIAKDVVLIQEVVVDQPEVTYEHASGGSNLDVIQRQVEAKIAAMTGAQKDAKPDPNEKKIIIEHFYMKGARAKVSAEMLQGKTMTVPLADIHLTGIGKKAGGVTPAEATRQIVGAITQSATKGVSTLNLGGVVDGVKKGASAVTESVKGLFK